MLAAFGPLFWLVPSKRERRLAAMRLQARRDGLTVEMRRFPKLDVAPEERVSAGGQPLTPLRESAVYLHPLAPRLRLLPVWRVLRGSDGLPAWPGWVFERATKPDSPVLPRVLAGLAVVVAALPQDVVALECESRGLGAYWLESPGTGPPQVTELAARLEAGARVLEALEAELAAAVEKGKI